MQLWLEAVKVARGRSSLHTTKNADWLSASTESFLNLSDFEFTEFLMSFFGGHQLLIFVFFNGNWPLWGRGSYP